MEKTFYHSWKSLVPLARASIGKANQKLDNWWTSSGPGPQVKAAAAGKAHSEHSGWRRHWELTSLSLHKGKAPLDPYAVPRACSHS